MRTWTVHISAAFLLLASAAVLPACSPPIATWDSAEPDSRVQVIAQAVREHDESRLPGLVLSLENDDPLVRMFAGDALLKLTGEDFGYRYYDPPAARAFASAKWRDWLARSRQPGNTSPTAPAAPSSSPSASDPNRPAATPS